jgi:hypothetical protein
MNEREKQEVFEYLDELRESGDTNMYGAGPYVQESFGVGRREAKSLVLEWMQTFGLRHKETTDG